MQQSFSRNAFSSISKNNQEWLQGVQVLKMRGANLKFNKPSSPNQLHTPRTFASSPPPSSTCTPQVPALETIGTYGILFLFTVNAILQLSVNLVTFRPSKMQAHYFFSRTFNDFNIKKQHRLKWTGYLLSYLFPHPEIPFKSVWFWNLK